jgi:hypothetical protein
MSHGATCPPPRIWRLPGPRLMCVVLNRSHSFWWSFWICKWSGSSSMTFGYSGVDAGALPAPALPGAAAYRSATSEMDRTANGPSRRIMRAMEPPFPRERPTSLDGQLLVENAIAP